MSCTAISNCQQITAFVDCIPSIYQGTDYYYEIQLFDEDGEPLDLNQIDGIFMCLYTDGYNYGTYQWPLPTDTVSEPIIIIQSEDTSGMIDVGIIGFNITSEMSAKFLTGNLFAEIKFKEESETTGNPALYKTIGCLTLGQIKQSLTKNINNF